MRVIKRNGRQEDVKFDKITERLKKLSGDLSSISPDFLAQKVLASIRDGIHTSEIDDISADVCVTLMTEHQDYETLASRIIVSNLQKSCPKTFTSAMSQLGVKVETPGLNKLIVNSRDFDFDYFGIKTLLKMYLMRDRSGKIIETPQYMFMRVAMTVCSNPSEIQETYEALSTKKYIHASPTLFNAASNCQQMSSCYLVAMKGDSLDSIYDTKKECALISKYGGGIGLHIHNIRSKGSKIRSTNGISDGIIPMLRTFNADARYCNQCFTPETIVYTNHGVKQIDEVCIGDTLVTIDGTHKRVNEVIRNHVSKKILNIRPTHSMETVRLTSEHEIYRLPNQKMVNHNVIMNRLEKKIIEPSFVSADTLVTGDLVGFPIPKLIVDFPEDDDYFRFYGIMIGDGHKAKARNEYGITLGIEKKNETIDFVKSFLTRRGFRIWTSVQHEGSCVSIRWSGNIDKMNLSRDMLYDSDGSKRIDHRFLHLPIQKTLSLIKGLIETDGSIVNEITFTNTSKNVMYSLRYMLLRCGILTSGYIKHPNTKYRMMGNGRMIRDVKQSWVLRIPKHKTLKTILGDSIQYSEHVKYFEWNGILWSRIRSIDTCDYSGYVYDLNMEENHNYMTDMGLVHNSGRRKGSFAIYLEPWHADIFDFLDLRLNQGDEESRCRDLFTALWVPDLFMKRLERDEPWSLFCPDEAPGLSDVHGAEFETLYTHYETKGLARAQVPIQKVWLAILKSQVETGTPYMLYKDSCNAKSNQKHLGTIKSSNLCVAPETFIKTRNGRKIISLLENKETEVWNGHEWSTVTVRKTADRAHLIEVEVLVNSRSCSVWCTPGHEFILANGSRTPAEELESGDVLKTWSDENGNEIHSKVIMLKQGSRLSSTYCFTEPIHHQAVFNGILTGQCAEIVEHSDSENTAVCNLASMALPAFVDGDGEFQFEEFERVVKIAVKNLNTVIDKNMYPVEPAEVSNMKLRPIALGVQGLADVFALMKIPFGSPESRELNKKIFETMYFAALQASCDLAKKYGSYTGFTDSPAAHGVLQFDLWGVTPTDTRWTQLKENIKTHGLRNSLLIGLMPTASTSQVLGYNECFEPFTTNIYLRRTLAGEFVIVNKYMVKDLQDAGIWSRTLKDKIIAQNGSIQSIPEIPDTIKSLYKTVWEIGPRVTIDFSRDRSPYVCQSQSMNLFVEDPTNAKMSSIHMYAWKQGLKTGMYYLRTRAKAKPQQVTIEPVQCVMCSA